MTEPMALEEPVVAPPIGGTVRVPAEVGFVYVFRNDTDYVVGQMLARMAAAHGLSAPAVGALRPKLEERYARFVTDLTGLFAEVLNRHGLSQIHVYPSEAIEAQRRSLLDPSTCWVSMDPLATDPRVHHLGVSRWYRYGGVVLYGEGFRPGFAPIEAQLDAVAEWVDGRPVSLIEDDTYTGDTLRAWVATLRAHHVEVVQVVLGIRICADLEIAGCRIDTAVLYDIAPGPRPFAEPIDLGDPRDYLLGASGLVVVLDGPEPGQPGQVELGRAPYLQPFLPTSARASTPAESDEEVARYLLEEARDFYAALSDWVGVPVGLEACDPYFAATIRRTRPDQANTPLTQLAGSLIDELGGQTATSS
jgi:hypothetical protein